MCIGKGMLATRWSEEPVYVLDSNDHSPLVEKIQAKDDSQFGRSFVRIEIWPCGPLFSRRKSDWEFRVDEEGALPEWFEDKKSFWEEKCKSVLVNQIITEWKRSKGVGGNLNLELTKITKLSDNLSVGGNLNLWNTKTTKLPDNLSVGGDLDLAGTKITELPDNLSVGGDLYLRGTKITKLPKSCKLQGKLIND